MKKSIVYPGIIIVVVIVVLLAVLIPRWIGGKYGEVRGEAVDTLSGDPVWKIRIVVGGKSTLKYRYPTKTYYLTGIEPGSYTLKAVAPNYYDFSKDIQVKRGENTLDISMKGKEIPDLQSIIVFSESLENGIQLEIRLVNSKGEGITEFPALSLELEGTLWARIGTEEDYVKGRKILEGPIELFWDSGAFLARNKAIIPWENIKIDRETEKLGILEMTLHTPQGDFSDTIDDIQLYKE
jgi:hypothetical protein